MSAPALDTLAEIIAGESACDDGWYPDYDEDEREYQLWQQKRDDEIADGEDAPF